MYELMKKNKQNALLCIPVIAIILLATSLVANAGGGFDRLPADEMYLDNPYWIIAVVTVGKVTTKELTEEGQLEITEVLRGEVNSQVINHAVWTLPSKHNDRPFQNTIRPNEWYERHGQEDWNLATPKLGDKLIVIFLKDQDLLNDPVKLVGIYMFSEKNKNAVLENMAPAERGAAIQIPLFLAILLNPIICFCVYMSSRTKSLTRREKKTRRLIIVWLTLLQFATYIFYESGISMWTNIRVDFLVVGPALLASIVIIIVSFACPGKKKENDI